MDGVSRALGLLGVISVAVAAACSSSHPTAPGGSANPSAGPPQVATTIPVGSGAVPTAQATGPATGVNPVPSFRHVYLLVLENKDFAAIVGSSEAPYLNSLIADYGLATNYHAIAHPSQPNYVALVSGSTQGVSGDGVRDLSAPNLADQLEAAGRDWVVFAQNAPSDCFTGAFSEGGQDGPGVYARKHEPLISFTSISGDAARCARIRDFTAFDTSAADFELIVPNQTYDMHDGSIQESDSFLADFIPPILAGASWRDGGVLFIVWDEGAYDGSPGGHVPLIVVSPETPPGFESGAEYDHYSLLRTIQDGLGLPCLGAACSASDLGEFFGV